MRTPKQAQRIQRLIDFLRKVEPHNWNFGDFYCGTTGCAIGHCPDIFRQWRRTGPSGWPYLVGGNNDVYGDAADFFGLTYAQSDDLFSSPYHYGEREHCKVSAEMVANELEKLL